jgi:hypothetical protein
MLSSHSEGIITTPVVNYDGSFPDNSNSAGNPQTGEPRLFCQFSESIAIPPRNTRMVFSDVGGSGCGGER